MLRRMVSEALERVRLAVAQNPGVPAGFIAVGVALVWVEKDGATNALVWIPGALLIVGLLVVVAVAAPGGIPAAVGGIVAIGAFAGFTAWSYLSILWADVPADAWSGANKTLAYFAIYTLIAIRPWGVRPAAALLGLYSIGVAAIGLWSFLRIDVGADPRLAFIAGRLIEPISYANGNSALFVSAAIPALFLASRRETPVVVRGALLAAVGILVELAALCQSRASLVAAPLVLALYFALAPGRLRSFLSLALVAVAVAASRGELLAVFTAVYGDDVDGARIAETVDAAQRVVLLSGVGLFLAGIAIGLVDRRLLLPSRMVRVLGVCAVVLVLAAGAAGGALFVDRYGDPVDRVSIWWGKFKADEYVSDAGTIHLTSGFGGAGRYALWTVAYRVFERHPIVGVGVDNFGVDWLRERPNTQDNIYPHSIELRTLQQTGLVGAALLSVFLVAALLSALRGIRQRPPLARGVSISALLVLAYWGVHGSVDWLWEIPALSAAAFGSLGLAAALSPTSVWSTATATSWRRLVVPGLATALTVFALATLVPPWLSARHVARALDSVADTDVAYANLARARVLNPFASEPDILGSVVAEQEGDIARQRSLLVQAKSRNRYDWFPHLQIGLIDARRGEMKLGLVSIERALRLNPRDESIRFAAERTRAGRPPSAEEMNTRYIESAASCCRP